jgi:putative acetyltransferase
MRRLARPQDLEAVFAIYMHERVVPFLGYDPMPLGAFRPIFGELVDCGCFYVYEVDGCVAGFYRATRHCTGGASLRRWCATRSSGLRPRA